MHPSTVILISFVTAALTAAGTVYVVERLDVFGHKPAPIPEVVVPDFHGLLEHDARTSAGAAHVALLVAAREPVASAKPGTIVRQSIPAGQRVSRDYPVNVVLAEEIPKVPTITNLGLEEATRKLKELGYSLEVGGKVAHETVPPEQVVSQMPKAGTAYVRGGMVTVQLSTGPGEVEVPKLVGLPWTKAKADVEQLGIKPVLIWTSLAETVTFVVLSQKPAPLTKVKAGSEVTLTVNR